MQSDGQYTITPRFHEDPPTLGSGLSVELDSSSVQARLGLRCRSSADCLFSTLTPKSGLNASDRQEQCMRKILSQALSRGKLEVIQSSSLVYRRCTFRPTLLCPVLLIQCILDTWIVYSRY